MGCLGDVTGRVGDLRASGLMNEVDLQQQPECHSHTVLILAGKSVRLSFKTEQIWFVQNKTGGKIQHRGGAPT